MVGVDPWLVAIIAPILYAVRTRTSVAMGITVRCSVAVVQVMWSMLYTWGWVDYWGLVRFRPRSREGLRTGICPHACDGWFSPQ